MNRTLKYIGILLGFVTLFATNACKDDISPVIEELQFDRIFTPLGLEAKISNQTIVSLSWGFNKGIDAYVLEISDDSLQFGNIIHTATVAPDELPYVYELPAGNSTYSARVKGTGSDAAESKWATLAFRSFPENLFNNYEVNMTGLGTVTVNWTPQKAVTSMVFVAETGETAFDISDEEMAAGVKNFSNLPNAAYEIRLMNETKVRGTQKYVLEGDVLIDAGGDLAWAILSAAPGDVIMLAAGGRFGFEGNMVLDKSVKIKGMDGQMPFVYATSGVKMFEIGSNLTPADSLVFQNLYLSGYVDQNVNDQLRGVFDAENDPCNIGSVKFIGCKLYNFGRQIVRLRGGADQTIGEFVVDDCIVHDLGRNSGSYGIFCATETNTNAGIVRISNSTIDSLQCHFIRYDDAIACESIIIENCTIDKTPFGSGRYLMDVRNAVISVGIEVKNCIFGSTSYQSEPEIAGIRTADGVALTITNSYVTTDFINTTYSIVDLCIPLGLSSTSFWNDPDRGDYSYSLEGVEAGDPRWW
jgi:hypothetical protein